MLDKTAATNINLAPNRQDLPASLWTDEKIARLKEMRAAGSSYSKIGDALGFTRGAISGKVDRLGLDKRARAPKRSDGGALARRLRSKGAADADRAATQRIAHRLKVRPPSHGGGAVMVESIIREEAPPRPEFLGIALLDLQRGQCRFPQGEGASILFCGQKTISGESWCRDCYRIVYQAPRPVTSRAHLPTSGSKPAVF